MDTIKTLNRYNTDTYGSWGIGQITKPINLDFEDILKYAISIQANVIVKPSSSKYWYIKGINNNKSFEDIKNHIETNEKSQYKKKSKTWLISY